MVDWDGTVTEHDTLRRLFPRFGHPEVTAEAAGRLGRGLTLRELLTLQFSTVRAPRDEVVDWVLAEAVIRRGFAAFVERYRPRIVSSGFHELIEPILAREGIEVELEANRVEPDPGGWRVRWRHETSCEICGETCKRSLLPPGPVVYVGDGYSDHCAALVADRVFATSGLAEYFDARGLPYEPFTDFVALERSLGANPPGILL